MKPAIVVGTRPEIIKMAPLVRACRARGVPHLLLHTGQHYSFELDGVFFAELGLPAPDVNLEVGSGTQIHQLASTMSGMEAVLARHRPDIVLVEGDTNSVLAAALAASRSGIAVGHVEAGLRSYDRGMPEELNRVLTDHLADHLFPPTARSRSILLGEGIPDGRILVTGNTVVDELLLQRGRARRPGLLERFGVAAGRFAMATLHRAENVDLEMRLRSLTHAFEIIAQRYGLPVIVSTQPPRRAMLAARRHAPRWASDL